MSASITFQKQTNFYGQAKILHSIKKTIKHPTVFKVNSLPLRVNSKCSPPSMECEHESIMKQQLITWC